MITTNLPTSPPSITDPVAIAASALKHLHAVKDSGVFDLRPIKITSQMGSLGPNGHPTYGYGLGLFFIAVGM